MVVLWAPRPPAPQVLCCRAAWTAANDELDGTGAAYLGFGLRPATECVRRTSRSPCAWIPRSARATAAHLLTGERVILGDGGYRAIPTIITPARDRSSRIICDDHYRKHRRIRARVEHVLARLKDWQILRQCRRRGHAINHSLHIIAGLWNIKTHNQLRVT